MSNHVHIIHSAALSCRTSRQTINIWELGQIGMTLRSQVFRFYDDANIGIGADRRS